MTSWTRPVVAIFVKTPGRSSIKTRLARDLGRERAESLYLDAVDCVRESVDRSRLPRAWAVAESGAADRAPWADAPCQAQPAGDLGTRMAGVFIALRARAPAVLLIGGDLPQLDPALLGRAADWLTVPDRHVMGPAADGGFWLYGSSAHNPTSGWPGLPYSRPDTAAQFRATIGGSAEAWLKLPTRTDLDESTDLAAVCRELTALDAPTAAQQRFRDRLQGIIDG
ncbi:DUF2064 domain-containing protein [Wenzhouxiangella sp. XN79A]|uniref:DUF2064 domain-containing protein n=1 Tax=Wenzhouxiangella sp. XN79A TaxID=2724193 RepID=UPI00144AB956|nr:DUF2064 domain-containing protein [Wenzhouxiangella sp. XN79A]